MSSPKVLSLVLGLSMFFVGICGISYEYTFSKLASDILGNSVKQWAIIIGLMMLFMGVGADLQKYLPDSLMVDQFIILEILLGLLGGFGPTAVLYSFGFFHDHFILIHYFCICAVGLMIGLEIPLLTRVNQKTVPSLKHNLGWILKMDYIGSFLGALIWVFVLPIFLNLLQISMFLGIVNTLAALLTWIWFRDWLVYPKTVAVSAGVVLSALSMGIFFGPEITHVAEQQLYKDPITYTQTTPYQHIVITENRAGDLYFYINGHLQFSSIDEYIYHEFLVHPVMASVPQRAKVLVLGGGDGLAVREILKYKEVESVTLVDIDPEMIRLAQHRPELRRLNEDALRNGKVVSIPAQGISLGARVALEQTGKTYFRRDRKIGDVEIHLIYLDAYRFVESIPGIYNAIIIDFPDPNSLTLSKLYSREFYELLKDKLAFDGLLIQQASSPTFAKEVFLVIGRTMGEAGFATLPIHHTVPSFGDWGWWIAGHRERYGQKGLKALLSDKQSLPLATRYISGELIRTAMVFGKNSLQSDFSDINTIVKDRVYFYYREAWEKYR